MKKDLPEVYANMFDKKIDNQQEYFYGNSKNRGVDLDYNEVVKKVDAIFHSPNYVYKANCEIKINNQIAEKIIVGKTKDSLITMDNEIINFKDIQDINIK